MKVFISSLIRDMEPIRAAAREAVASLGHEAIMAEEFPAQPQSPQVACLEGVRTADAVVLVLGAIYGARQASGLSATHEEFREAKDRRPVFAFMQRGVQPDAEQAAFVAEVRGWVGGLFSPEFGDPADLRNALTKAIHHWQLSTASGPLDPKEVLGRALAAFPGERNRGSGAPLLQVVVAGGPGQSILRPSRIEDASFSDRLLETAMFGADRRIFSPREGSDTSVRDGRLVLSQGQRLASIDELGTVAIHLDLAEGRGGLSVIIEEDVADRMALALRYADWLLDEVDATHRLSNVVLAAAVADGGYNAWRTRREHEASPNSGSMGRSSGGDRRPPVHLTPPNRPRAALKHEAANLVTDLVTLLRRHWK